MLDSASASDGADDKVLNESEVPKPVLHRIHAKYKTAPPVGFKETPQEGKTTYEVRIDAAQ